MSLIAENEDGRIHFDCGSGGDVLVITFSHMDFDWVSERYWGDQFFAKLGIPCLGVTAKGNNWHPVSIKEFAPAIDEITSLFRTRLCYGFSMGGYAALKYSKLFQATHILALSPQFSIDPRFGDERYSSEFLPDKHEPLLEPDVVGATSIVFDPYFAPDAAEAAKILAIAPNANVIHASGKGHFTADLFSGSESMTGYIQGLPRITPQHSLHTNGPLSYCIRE